MENVFLVQVNYGYRIYFTRVLTYDKYSEQMLFKIYPLKPNEIAITDAYLFATDKNYIFESARILSCFTSLPARIALELQQIY